ncbi:MAG: M15 family metallopeptidase [Alphaproteobacteria bacterium]|nr:M15 family metallopeptidase [Alphaproteobacteria bacterium]
MKSLIRFFFFALLLFVSDATAENNDFYIQPLSDALKKRITGISFPYTPAEISYDDLVDIHVLHYDFNNRVQKGRLICNKKIGQKVLAVFQKLYDNAYQIEKIRLIDDYKGDDDASMRDNNTSCFNYRKIAGSNKLSNHSLGLAVDINPLYNPYIKRTKSKTVVFPEIAADYADRTKPFPHKIDKNDLAYKAFTEQGFFWGGSWISVKDYQHFEY